MANSRDRKVSSETKRQLTVHWLEATSKGKGNDELADTNNRGQDEQKVHLDTQTQGKREGSWSPLLPLVEVDGQKQTGHSPAVVEASEHIDAVQTLGENEHRVNVGRRFGGVVAHHDDAEVEDVKNREPDLSQDDVGAALGHGVQATIDGHQHPRVSNGLLSSVAQMKSILMLVGSHGNARQTYSQRCG
ncbi:hypothetical protein FH972_022368 [Carpinus fangiana]|uniref:Uncharacterized protein n=1 Tax=Carpinus fangiana TaxID=176857 RepID=A0A5N6KSE5_9ROSI|nr:hypothetical protein FH972_022368 [Carpinus fangiana]